MKFITLINDCSDDNAKARQITRWSTFFPGVNISFVGINSSLGLTATLEAAGNLIDILDASGGESGVVALNVAPRGQIRKDGPNGSRFCYFYHKKTLVVSTVKGYNLSFIKRFGLVKYINILDTDKVLNFAYKRKLISYKLQDHISKTQFRSFDFQPRIANWLQSSIDVPYTKVSINEFPDIPSSVWCVDSFGNIKTTVTKIHAKKKTKYNLYDRLKDVPDGETAIYRGSSGIGSRRFIEIATQNRSGSAAKSLGLKVGDLVEL